MHLCGQLNCWTLRCSWSIACRHCSNYIFILNLIRGFNRLVKDDCKTRRETFKFWNLVRLQLEIWWYIEVHLQFEKLHHVNSLGLGRCGCNLKSIIFKLIWRIDILWNCPQVNATRLHWWLVSIGSCNGLVLSGNKPLPEPVLTQIYVAIWNHWSTTS